MGLDKDQEVRAAKEEAEREILVRKLLKDEIAARVKIESADVQLYFDAKKREYRDPARAKVRHIAVSDREKAEAVRADIAKSGLSFEAAAAKYSLSEETSKKGGEVGEELVEGGYHPLFPNVAEVLELVLKTDPGRICEGTVQAGGKQHLIQVVSKSEGRDKGFEEVKDAVARDLRMERERAALNEILAKALETSGAKIHEDRIGGEAESRPETQVSK
jgi:parvulin-like peptidyl-prolyl isomerase